MSFSTVLYENILKLCGADSITCCRGGRVLDLSPSSAKTWLMIFVIESHHGFTTFSARHHLGEIRDRVSDSGDHLSQRFPAYFRVTYVLSDIRDEASGSPTTITTNGRKTS